MTEPSGETVRVSTLELFFDLVFVFTITQLTAVLVEEPTARGVPRVVLMLGVIWWMYGGYAWLTNAVSPNSPGRRFLLLGGMAGFLVMALSIPGAFDGSGAAFGLAYLAVVLVHAGLFTRSSSESVVRAILALVPFNITTGLLVLAGASRQRRPALALEAFGYWHIPILLGIIATAAGIKKATGHPGDHLHIVQALELGGGAALFMLGVLLFRRTLAIGGVRWRAGALAFEQAAGEH